MDRMEKPVEGFEGEEEERAQTPAMALALDMACTQEWHNSKVLLRRKFNSSNKLAMYYVHDYSKSFDIL